MQKLFFILLALAVFPFLQAQTPVDANTIMMTADRYRGSSSWGFELNIMEFKEKQGQKPEVISESNFLASSKIFGEYPNHTIRCFVQFTTPQNEFGKKMLMDGQIYWMFFPDTKNLVRITAQQRIVGQATASDIASTNFSADYNATLAGEEEVLKKDCYKLKLTQKNENVAYGSLNYWVEKESFQPIKVEYFSINGQLLKTAYFRNFKNVPTLGIKSHELFIIDAVENGSVTRMRYSNLREENRPEYFFRKDSFAGYSLLDEPKELTASDILKGSDKYRGGENWGFSLDILDFQEKENSQIEMLGKHEFAVNSRTFPSENNDVVIKCFCKFVKPEETVGQKMLMDGQIYWMFFPATKNLVRITPAQRLAGQATAADIASTNFSYDYIAEFGSPKTEKVLEKECYKLVLTAKPGKEVAYPKMNYWVEKENLAPVKVEYFTASDSHLKTSYYRGFKAVPSMNHVKAHEIFIVDAVTKGHVTRMIYKNINAEESPEYMFRKDNLGQ